MTEAATNGVLERTASGPWTDLGLTLPIFIAYHLGVVWLPARNAADWVTHQLVQLADHDLTRYVGLTLCVGLVYVGTLWVLGRGQALNGPRFLWISIEGVLYAIAMRLTANYAVARLFLEPRIGSGSSAAAALPAVGDLALAAPGLAQVASGVVMSFGAGFYEEIAFRVGLFGLGWRLLCILFPLHGAALRGILQSSWALLCALVFSGWHYVGEFGDRLDLHTFTFRMVCGLVFTAVYRFRGFAPAVWTHSLYDIWVITAR